jgi:hypothetical protein
MTPSTSSLGSESFWNSAYGQYSPGTLGAGMDESDIDGFSAATIAVVACHL